MRTTDFSAAPPQGQATAMFIGATRYSGPLAMLRTIRTWRPMVRQMKRMAGYRWHTVYYRFPYTLGTIAFFSDRDAMLKFARSRHHRDLMCWLTDEGARNATAGFIRLHSAEPHGYTFWDYFRNAFVRDAGLRIDHLLLSPQVAPRLRAAGVDREVRSWEKTSDHAPTWIELAD